MSTTKLLDKSLKEWQDELHSAAQRAELSDFLFSSPWKVYVEAAYRCFDAISKTVGTSQALPTIQSVGATSTAVVPTYVDAHGQTKPATLQALRDMRPLITANEHAINLLLGGIAFTDQLIVKEKRVASTAYAAIVARHARMLRDRRDTIMAELDLIRLPAGDACTESVETLLDKITATYAKLRQVEGNTCSDEHEVSILYKQLPQSLQALADSLKNSSTAQLVTAIRQRIRSSTYQKEYGWDRPKPMPTTAAVVPQVKQPDQPATPPSVSTAPEPVRGTLNAQALPKAQAGGEATSPHKSVQKEGHAQPKSKSDSKTAPEKDITSALKALSDKLARTEQIKPVSKPDLSGAAHGQTQNGSGTPSVQAAKPTAASHTATEVPAATTATKKKPKKKSKKAKSTQQGLSGSQHGSSTDSGHMKCASCEVQNALNEGHRKPPPVLRDCSFCSGPHAILDCKEPGARRAFFEALRRHTEEEKAAGGNEESIFETPCRHCQKDDHTILECRDKGAEDTLWDFVRLVDWTYQVEGQERLESTCVEAEGPHLDTQLLDTPWVIADSAPVHMTPCRDLVRDMQPHNLFTVLLDVGRGIKLTSAGIGQVILMGNDGKTLTLNNVLYVPGMTEHVMSTMLMSRDGFTVEKTKKGCKIVETKNKKKVVATGTHDSETNFNLFDGCALTRTGIKVTDLDGSRANMVPDYSEALLWHRRLGHMPMEQMKRLPGAVDGVPSDLIYPDKFLCAVCDEL